MAESLTISDGTTTIDFHGGDYHVLWEGWAPAVARRVEGSGGGNVYEDVDEEMGIAISGDTAADIRAKLGALQGLLDQADRWRRGENVDAVLITIEPKDSTVGEVRAAVLGFAEFEVPREFHTLRDGLQLGTAETPIIVRFTRRGAWLAPEEARARVNSGLASGNVRNFASGNGFASTLPNVSPLRLHMQGFERTQDHDEQFPQGFFILNELDCIAVYEAEDVGLNPGGSWSTEDESANFARGDEVARLDAASGSATVIGLGDFGLGTKLGEASALQIFAVMRSSSSDTAWRLTPMLSNGQPQEDQFPRTRPIVFEATVPTAVNLGTVMNQVNEMRFMRVDIERLSGSGHLDIDYFVITDPTRPDYNITHFSNVGVIPFGFVQDVILDHRLLTHPTPQVRWQRETTADARVPIPHRGNILWSVQAEEVSFIHVTTGKDNGGDYWRWTHDEGVEFNFVLDLYRTPAYPIPR